MSPLLVLIVAVLATTYAGPIVRLAAAPAVAIAFWRLVLVLPVTFGVATRERARRRGSHADRTRGREAVARRRRGRCAGAGRRADGRGLLRDRATGAPHGGRLELRLHRVRGRGGVPRIRRGAAGGAAHGVRPPRLDRVRRAGRRADAHRPHGDELRAQTLPRDDRERRRAGRAGGRERDRVAGAGHTRGAGVLDGDRRLTRAGGDRNVVEDRTGDGAWPCGLNSSGEGRSKPGTTSTSPWSTGPASSLPTWAIPTSSPTGARRRSRS